MSAFAENAHAWVAAGWGAFPLPAGQKSPPPQGWTGRGAPYPSGADVQAWIEEEGTDGVDADANLGLRFPVGVIGIDVDEYVTASGDHKHGLKTLIACTKTWGKLPPTSRITSRPDTRSGIYLYRLPDDVSSDRFMGELPGGDVEILRPEHRYAVGPGSLHPEGRTYVMVEPDGCFAEDGETLRREQLPELPMAWVEGLTLNEKVKSTEPVNLAGGRGDAYAQAAVERVVAELHSIADWPIGKTDEKGRGWEKIQADAAYRLASLALAEWNSLTIEQAMRAFAGAAPVGGGWTGADIASKWRSQMRRAEPADPPKTQTEDPLAPGYAFEEMVINGGAAADSRGDDGRSADRPDATVVVGDPPDGAPAASVAAPGPSTQVAAEWVKHSWDDRGNAERVLALFGSRLRYLPAADRWMEYDEEHGRWEESKLAGPRAVMRMIDALPKLEGHLYSVKKYPKGKGETSDYEEFQDWVASQRYSARYRAAADVLKTTGMIDESVKSFDADPRLLNCRNGILDLRTGQLLKHDPVRKLRRQIPVDYIPDAPAPKWLEYVEHAHPDAELQDYLQRIAGYSVTGMTTEQVFFIHYGPPRTGKSLFLDVMGAMMGDLARVVPSTTLMRKKNEGHPTEIMGLAGRRLLTMSESAEGAGLDAALVKRLSGSDVITARGMGEDFQDFKLVGKIHLVTNHLPHIPDDAALQRRIHVIPWNVQVDPADINYDLAEEIVAEELPGVLAWAVRGVMAWHARRLDRPDAAHLAALDYFAEEDEFGQFLDEKLTPAEVVWTSTAALYRHYSQWCSSNNIRPMSRVAFGRKMSARGFKQARDASARGYYCTLKNDPINADPLAP